MQLKAFLPLAPRSKWDSTLVHPQSYGKWNELSRDDKGVYIEFEVENHVHVLDEVLNAYVLGKTKNPLTSKNVKQVWAAIRKDFVGRVGYRTYGGVLSMILAELEHGMQTVYEFKHNQKGLGFMGGTGCGTKIHQLSYSVITGVRAGLDPLVTEVAQAWYNLMLGELRYQRSEHKHLRDNIQEADLVLTYGARPRCQKTVRYVGAKGYPLRNQNQERAKITCSKCQGLHVNDAKQFHARQEAANV